MKSKIYLSATKAAYEELKKLSTPFCSKAA